jgi:hypothetical protein
MLARASRDPPARFHNPDLQRPTIKKLKFVPQNPHMKQSYFPRRIFLPAFICLDFPNMAISLSKPDVAAPGAGLADKSMGAQA